MDELRRHAAWILDRWQRLARGQRVALFAALLASAAGFCWLIASPQAEWQAIGNGREFTAAELTAIQSAWRARGLKSFRRDGRQLRVPATDLLRYEGALPKLPTTQATADNEWDKQLVGVNVFTSHQELEQRRDNALRHELRRVLKAIPAIADADVIWARSKSRSAFATRSRVTATINVVPREGFDLTPELAQSLRTAVAGMIPDLVVDDIAILDQSTGLAITGQSDELIAEQQLRRQQQRDARQLETRIAAALAEIPNVIVQATLTQAPPSPNRHTAAKPTFGSAFSFASEVPDNLVELSPVLTADSGASDSHLADSSRDSVWQVAVQIPESYLDARAAQQLLNAEQRGASVDDLRNAESARVRQVVQSLLPPNAARATVSVVPGIVVADPTELSPPFAAWPHLLLCGCLAVVSLTLVTLRPRRQTRTRSDRGSPRTSTDGDTRPILPAPTCEEPHNVPAVGEQPIVSSASVTNEPVSELARLQQVEPRRLAAALRQERPQAIAVLLSRFPARSASVCLSQLTASQQTDVIRRLKSLGEVPDELLAEVARAVSLRLTSPGEQDTHEPTNRIAQLLADANPRKVCA
jgi:hypothetical protein